MFSRSIAVALLVVAPTLANAAGVYWTDRGASQLKRMNFDGSNLQTIALSGAATSPGSNIRGIAADNVSNRIYWADNGADQLLRANLDGSDSTILYTVTGGNSFPADVRLDLGNQFLYWCDQLRNRIQRSTLGGASVIDVITNAAPTGPYFMDLDVPAGKIYWGDFGGGSIFRANLDGSSRETLLTGNNMTRGVRLDPRERMLYWINRDDKKVHRCPLLAFAGGTIPLTHPAVQTLYTNLDTPHGLALDIPARKLYWADTGTNPGNGTGGQSVCRGDFDGSTPLEILATGTEPWDVDLDLRCANYTEWTQRCFRRDALPAQTAPDADPDGDGIPNAVEYAFDLSPMHADRSELPAGFVAVGPTQGDYHAVNYHRRIGTSDLHYEVQVSTNLTQWAEGATVEIQVTPLGDGMESASARTLYTVSGYTNHFMRVRTTFGP
jgi:Low-density lipoprotein receptor repeat class B